jgi:hypothetical protein
MGVVYAAEYADYIYLPRKGKAKRAPAILVELGAVRRDPTDISNWIMKGQDHWIDIEYGASLDCVLFRIALCNPPAAMDVLHRALAALMSDSGGNFIDPQANKRYVDITPATWEAVLSDHERKKAKFKELFGEFTAAISVDDVYSEARKKGFINFENPRKVKLIPPKSATDEELIGRSVWMDIDVDHCAVEFSRRKVRILAKVHPPIDQEWKEEWLAELNKPIRLWFPWPRTIRMVLIRYLKGDSDTLASAFDLRRFGGGAGCWAYAWTYGVKKAQRAGKRLRHRDLVMLGAVDLFPALWTPADSETSSRHRHDVLQRQDRT